MCHAIVSTGGYLLAWIGYTEDDAGKTVRPMAYAGYKPGYMEQANITWADVELGQGPVGRAIRSGTPQIVQDALSDPSYKPWRQNAEKIGYRALIALPLSSSGTILGVLSIYSAETNAFDEEEIKLLKELAEDIAFGIVTLRTRTERDRIAHEQLHHVEILRQSLEDALKAIADTVVARDPYTAGHQTRVGQLAVAIAREMGLPEETIHGIGLAASVHDLGKISVPAEILSKPGRLTDIEYMLVKTHVQSGYDILKDIRFPWPIAIMVWQHHERMDGSGYPQGLKGDEIMLESRILAVADVVEAMASHRPYRPALGIEAALGEIERGRGSVYDATVVDACLKVFREKEFAFQG
jgi:HD-GYP domain-containing protein (c-di-GMP phosphodiesterase class II)